jgi:hypothetical protein
MVTEAAGVLKGALRGRFVVPDDFRRRRKRKSSKTG